MNTTNPGEPTMSTATTDTAKKPSKPPMTNRGYVRVHGTKCPFCRSEDIVGDDINVDGGQATQEMSCNECDAEWEDVYRLIGYQAA